MATEHWKKHFEETGEIRPPRKGEWFLNYTQNLPVRAEFDFMEAAFRIIKPISPNGGKDGLLQM